MERLFGSSGIRDVANQKLTPLLAAQVGLAVGTYSKSKNTIVARDTRTTGQMLEAALTAGLVSTGSNVKIMGILPTPALAFLIPRLKADSGIMVTASHNPPQYNGIKIFSQDGSAYSEQNQNALEKVLTHQEFRRASWQNIGMFHSSDESRIYVDAITRLVELRKKWHVVLDPGNGATYAMAPRILENLGCKISTLNAQPDGFFPGRGSEPNKKSLQSLSITVRKQGANLGIAYDGDGDRVAFVDETGLFTNSDRILATYAGYVTEKQRHGIVVTNVEASMGIEKMVEANNGTVLRSKVGDIYVSEMMKKRKAVFGGEPCGAWIHPKIHYCPDGILSSALLLNALEEKDQSLSEFVSQTPEYRTLRENLPVDEESQKGIIERINEDFQTVFKDCTEISKIDGIRISLQNGWILIRPSGTEPLIRLTVEGESLKTAQNIMKKGIKLVKRARGT